MLKHHCYKLVFSSSASIYESNSEKPITEKSNILLQEEIKRKQKQADIKIDQAKDDAIREVKAKAAELSLIIAKEYLKENIDDKISSDLIDKSIIDLKNNL